MTASKNELEKKMRYMLNMRPILDRQALFSDGTENFRIPSEPKAGETVRIRFRTKRNNVDGVWLVTSALHQEMALMETQDGFDYYETSIVMGEDIFRYSFEILSGNQKCYYNHLGCCVARDEAMDFEIYPGFDTPDWAKGAVMYQIFVDRFYNADPTNDVVTNEYFYIGEPVSQVKDWGKPPAAMGVREFYGGDLQGVQQKLDYLQDLGVEVIYLNPIFVSPSNHKYDCQDYDFVDPHFGKIVEDCENTLDVSRQDNRSAVKYIRRVTDKRNLEASNQVFVNLVEDIHRRGMKIILDGVFNHCGSFNKWMDRELLYEREEGYVKGAYVSDNSPYRHYFHFNDANEWPYNGTYDGWWGHDTLPKLNYEESEELYQEVLSIGRKWVSAPYNIDGWRLDVAADLGHSNGFNHRFWKDFRRAVKEANPEAVILAEHYGNPEGWLQGDEWDTVMNYDAFMEPVTWFLTGMEKHSDSYNEDMFGNSEAFIQAMKYNMRCLHMSALTTAMNELSNHDHSRFLSRTNHQVGRVADLGPEAADRDLNPAVMREAVAIQMTWPGAPTVYYGDEVGVTGFTDPDNRRTFPWGREDWQMMDFHRIAIRIHRTYPVLKTGSLEFLWNDYQGLSYARFNREEQVIVVINNQEESRRVSIEAWKAGLSRSRDSVMERILLSDANSFAQERAWITAKGGILNFVMPAFGVMILHHKNDVTIQKDHF